MASVAGGAEIDFLTEAHGTKIPLL